MARFLVIYATKYGQTQKIARFIVDQIARAGHSYDLFECKNIAPTVSPEDYDFVIIGAPVLMHQYPRQLVKWARTHAKSLDVTPSAFFSVCLGIVQNDAEVEKQERQIVENFFRQTRWRPGSWAIFGGAFAFSKYNIVLKWIMKKIAKAGGSEVSTDQDYEYTHWNAVRKFTEDLIQSSPWRSR